MRDGPAPPMPVPLPFHAQHIEPAHRYFVAFHVAAPGLSRFGNAAINSRQPLDRMAAIERLQEQIAAQYRPMDKDGVPVVGVAPMVTILSFQRLESGEPMISGHEGTRRPT